MEFLRTLQRSIAVSLDQVAATQRGPLAAVYRHLFVMVLRSKVRDRGVAHEAATTARYDAQSQDVLSQLGFQEEHERMQALEATNDRIDTLERLQRMSAQTTNHFDENLRGLMASLQTSVQTLLISEPLSPQSIAISAECRPIDWPTFRASSMH